MDLGSLDKIVTFRRKAFKVNARNERIPDGFETLATVCARREPVRDGERNAGAQVQREVSDRFTTHWSGVLDALDLTEQLLCEGVVYDLVGRKPLGRRQGFEWSANALPPLKP